MCMVIRSEVSKMKIYDNYTITPEGDIFNKYNKKMSLVDNGKGYLVLGLTLINGKRIVKSVHRLLAEAFIENPLQLSDVNHIDGNRLNNNLSNLEWVSHGDNIKHSYSLGNRCAKGINNANCITTEETVLTICEYLESGLKPFQIRDLGFNYSLVRGIKSRKRWCHISCNFNF